MDGIQYKLKLVDANNARAGQSGQMPTDMANSSKYKNYVYENIVFVSIYQWSTKEHLNHFLAALSLH